MVPKPISTLVESSSPRHFHQQAEALFRSWGGQHSAVHCLCREVSSCHGKPAQMSGLGVSKGTDWSDTACTMYLSRLAHLLSAGGPVCTVLGSMPQVRTWEPHRPSLLLQARDSGRVGRTCLRGRCECNGNATVVFVRE